MRHPSSAPAQRNYRHRFLVSLAAVLVMGIALVRWWPSGTSSQNDGSFGERRVDRIDVREIQPTAQSRELAPPPPAPLPPVVVPNDEVIEEDLDFGESALHVDEYGEDAQRRAGTTDSVTAQQVADTQPRLFRTVQPEYPPAARDEGIRARIQVSVLVTKEGKVRDASIAGRWRLTADGSATSVEKLNYGLENAALTAAYDAQFQPATHDGTPVESRTSITFEFGPERD